MRLRRLEFVIIGLTLAFACFMGGFFTGRNWSAVNIVPVAAQYEDMQSVEISIISQDVSVQEQPVNPATPAAENTTAPQSEPQPNQPSETETPGAPRAGDGKININLASQSELTDLPGIGPALASRIVDYRRQHGDFQRIEDIRNVSGIGEKRFEALQDKITVGS